MSEEKKQYLGDGVYISNDGWHVSIETERENGTNIIYLEPSLIAELVRYADRVGIFNGKALAEEFP